MVVLSSQLLRAVVGDTLSGHLPPLVDVVIDHFRGFMYTLDGRSTVTAYTLGEARDEMKRSDTFSYSSLCSHLPGGLSEAAIGPVVKLAVMSPYETPYAILVAVTLRGYRIYLRCPQYVQPSNTEATGHRAQGTGKATTHKAQPDA